MRRRPHVDSSSTATFPPAAHRSAEMAGMWLLALHHCDVNTPQMFEQFLFISIK